MTRDVDGNHVVARRSINLVIRKKRRTRSGRMGAFRKTRRPRTASTTRVRECKFDLPTSRQKFCTSVRRINESTTQSYLPVVLSRSSLITHLTHWNTNSRDNAAHHERTQPRERVPGATDGRERTRERFKRAVERMTVRRRSGGRETTPT